MGVTEELSLSSGASSNRIGGLAMTVGRRARVAAIARSAEATLDGRASTDAEAQAFCEQMNSA